MSTRSRSKRAEVDLLLNLVNERLENLGQGLQLAIVRWNPGDWAGMRSQLTTENQAHNLSRVCSTAEMYEALYVLTSVLVRIECSKDGE